MAVLVISREYGAGGGGGNEIAVRICDILGYQYFDKRLMLRLARDKGLTEEEVIDFSAETYEVRSFVERLPGRRGPRLIGQARVWRGTEDGREVQELQHLDETYGINLAKSMILAAHQHGNTVIVGRGGQVILNGMPDVLRVRIIAPLEVRCQRVSEAEGISLKEAETNIINRDRASEAYLKRFYDLDWAAPQHYDMVINTALWGIEGSTRILVNAIGQMPQTVERITKSDDPQQVSS